jgi:mannose-6-phosphate isomerase-like protein (cupin superfamily)
MRRFSPPVLAALLLATAPLAAQAPQNALATDRGKATLFTAAELQAALAKLPGDRPSGAVRVFSLAPYNVGVERRNPQPQGASMHEDRAELFYVIDGAATLLTGGTIASPKDEGVDVRGPGITGGTPLKFGKGDFMIVPAGVPHQFVDIASPVTVMSMYLPDAPK